MTEVEFIESYRKVGNDYQWNDNHGELIRCKDCKYCRDYCRIIEDVKYEHACALKEECGYPYGQFRVSEDDYCSRAERKEE